MTTGIASTSVATTSSGNFTVSTVNSVFVLNAKAYGAKGDGQVVSDGAMTSGSATLTSATANFSSADVGKLVLVKDALTGPNTLSGTITGFTSATQVTLSVSATRTVSNATVFWGTDDKSAVNTAISDAAALNPGGAMIQFDAGRFCFSDSIDLSNRIGIGLQGSGNMTGGGPPGTQLLLFDNTTKNLVKATTSSGVVIKNMQLLAFATQYSGTLVLANSGTPQVCHILNASLDARGSTATLLDLSTGNGIVVERVLFSYGGTQVIGSNTANNIVIRSCEFLNYATVAIKDPGQAWAIEQCVFEPGSSNQAAALTCASNAHGLRIVGCWTGDNTATTSGQVWFSVKGVGIEISGNYIANFPTAQNVTGIKFTAASQGVAIKGNTFELGSGSGTVCLDLGNFAHVGLDAIGNAFISGVTHITGAGSVAGGEGLVTMFGAKSWSSSAQTLANATLTAVTFGTNLVNRGSVWSGGANTKFTVPTGGAGTWLVNAGVVFANNTTGIREMFVRKNGSTYVARVGPPAATGTNQSQVLITYVDPSAADADYYEIIVRQDSGGNLNTIVVDSGYTWATAVKIA